jgi:O-ureido-D-serine cyclo-ligase
LTSLFKVARQKMTPSVCIALVTARAARDLDDDLAPLAEALREQNANTHIVDWDDPATDWSIFDLALLRSPWDYTQRAAEFLAWIESAAAATTLFNPLAIVRWNIDKHYLDDLAQAGVPVVPSTFVEPGANAQVALEQFLKARVGQEFVVKPAVGAGSRDAQRHAWDDRAAAVAHVQRLLASGRSALLQPYLDRVDEHGETALIYFNGTFSHAIRKGPLLRRGEGPTRALFATEHIQPRTPTADELLVAERALSALPFAKPLLYARVDLIRDAAGGACVLELELIEPSLFFAHATGSAQRFAAAAIERAAAVAQSGTRTART